jgi:hypothetical protein
VFGGFLHFIGVGQLPAKAKYRECEVACSEYQIAWRHRSRGNAVAMPLMID